jgi:hypothetical protein
VAADAVDLVAELDGDGELVDHLLASLLGVTKLEALRELL